MNRIKLTRMLATAILVTGLTPAEGQFLDYGRAGFGGGIMVDGVLGQTELQDKADAQVRAHISHGLTERLSAQLGVGYVALSGNDYDTDIGQIDLRLQYSVHPMERISPFAYIGAGGLRYDLASMSSRRTDDAEPIGWSAVIPVGVGVKMKVGSRLSIDLGAGYTHTFRDDINSAIARKGSDVYWGLRLGFDIGGDPDPDGDGLFALAEKRAGSDPYRKDTDGDGLPDGVEVRVHGTNPASADTDGDGSPDRVEVILGLRDPLRADAPKPAAIVVVAVAPEPEPEPVVVMASLPNFADLYFAFGRANLAAAGSNEVERLVDLMHDRPDLVVDLRGHTDSVGSRSANLRVAGRRANHVKGLLVALGISDQRIQTSAVGPDEPVAPNTTAAGREANRRVEIVVAGSPL
ncbi:MAG: OmpA family protein [Gemmatimonadetes bacterium]|jgi:outer membrane protein OmpA-like peptidoglycan-associated protein/opacity protein-like surface antigen|nr:OmpA family protein [Gemmatimonadota bacterium]MBT6150244.1 OmpA family protein [Gemmatimonadota bacterium]MBT7864648.1 OmpA family protein [Gemmatimonadota bacterium]